MLTKIPKSFEINSGMWVDVFKQVNGKPLVICCRWRDPTELVFGCSRSFSPCVVKQSLARLRPLLFAACCWRSCQNYVFADHLICKWVICVKWHIIQKLDFEIRILKVLLLLVLIVTNWVQALFDAR